MFITNKLARAVKLACAVGAASMALSSNVALAQDAEDSADSIEKIEVTGSRIKRASLESSSPVLEIDAEAIQSTGFSRIEDVMNQLPQIEAAQSSFVSNGATGTASLDLRGLGVERTLVLVNGRRLQPGGVYTQAADVNQIPTSLIKRVDVLTGGASTTYGADAVAGVVNFVMDDKFTGVEINAGASGYQHDNDNSYIQGLMDESGYDYPDGSNGIGGEAYTLDITMGSEFAEGDGHIVTYATWRRNNEMLQGERDYSSCALNNAGTSCGGSANSVLPTMYIYPWTRAYDGDGNYLTGANGNPVNNPGPNAIVQLDPSGNFVPYDATQLYNYAPVNHFMRPNERFSLGAFADYAINDDHSVYLETSFMRDRTSAQIAESGTFFAQNYALGYDNPLLSADQVDQIQGFLDTAIADFETANPELQPVSVSDDTFFLTEIGKRNVEGGQRVDQLEHNSFRIVTGLEGYINNMWSYDVSYQHGSTSSSSGYINDFYVDRIGPRLNAEGIVAYDADGNPFLSESGSCTGNCLPYNVFTPNGVTVEQAQQMAGTAIMTGVTTQRIYSGYVTGEFDYSLPSATAPIAAVLGFERREIDYERTADTLYQEGALAGQGGPTPSISGQIDVNEVYAELSIPLLEDASFAESFVLELAGRTSDYSTSGRANTFKVALDWVITDEWKFRTSYNRAIRAPNVTELYEPQAIGLWSGADPCAGGEPSLSAEACANTGVDATQYGSVVESPASQYNEFAGGDPDLQPEEADTLTVGIVGNPLENLNFSLDYWDIEIENVISDIGASRILNTCASTGDDFFCDNIVRAGNGSLWIGETGYVRNLPGNIGGRKWRGIDATANYTLDIGGGILGFSLNGSYNLEKTFKPLLTDSSLDYDCSGEVSVDCFAQPKWRHTLTTNYKLDDWTFTARWRYFGEVDYSEGTDSLVGDGISAASYFDLTGSYFLTNNISVSVGANNILDKEPPMVGGTLSSNANTVAGFYDTLGRYLFTNVNVRF